MIGRIDHFAGDLPILRLPNGALVTGDPDLFELADTGNVVALGADGVWRLAPEASWEPIVKVGAVRHVDNEFALIEVSAGTLTRRSVAADQKVAVGDLVVYDERPTLLEKIATPTPIRPSMLDDDFKVDSIKTTPANLHWGDFAGFPALVQAAREVVAAHMNVDARTELERIGVSPVRGILFNGPPGTGKTFLAQIMAAQSGATFYLVTTASLGGRLVSESEQRLQQVYTEANEQDLSIVFIDEIDSLTGHRGSEDRSASRLVNVFLTNMDGIAPRQNVITIGTTNMIDSIDRALRRPGRFDRSLTFSLPSLSDRLAILQNRNRVTSGDLSFHTVAERTDQWTAADLEAIWQHAGELTVISGRTAIHDDHFLIGFERAKRARDERQGGSYGST